MKKAISMLLCLALAATMLCGVALADGIVQSDYVTSKDGTMQYKGDGTNHSYTATCGSGIVEGNQYILMVVKGSESSYTVGENTIMYIEQVTATGSSVSFEDFVPRSVPDSVVLLGGEFASGGSPKVLGTIVGKGVTVSGKVNYLGTRTNATVTLTDENDTVIATTETGSDGSYMLGSVPLGTYTLKVTKNGHLSHTKKNVAIEGETTLPAITLLPGDGNNSGGVNIEDLSPILNNFGKDTTEQNKICDINESGGINIEDLSPVLNNFGKNSVVID